MATRPAKQRQGTLAVLLLPPANTASPANFHHRTPITHTALHARTQKLRHKYDLGPQANLKQVMGSSPLQWFFPTPPETDGYHSLTYPNLNNQFELW